MLIDTVEGRVTQTKLGIVGKIQMFMCMHCACRPVQKLKKNGIHVEPTVAGAQGDACRQDSEASTKLRDGQPASMASLDSACKD
jgi:hypothetical protein